MSDSARVYLSFLAVVDTCYLLWVTLLDLSLVFLQPQPFWHAHPWCGVLNFLQFGMFYASAWLVVAFTIERYLVFRVMVIRQRHLQVRHALLTCTAIILLSHLASIPLSWINTVVQVQFFLFTLHFYSVYTVNIIQTLFTFYLQLNYILF